MFFHDFNLLHRDLRLENIMKNDKGEYKLFCPRLKIRDKNVFYYLSPEEYQEKYFREAVNKAAIDYYKSEIFTVGILILMIGNFQSYEHLYNKFSVNEEGIAVAIKVFSENNC